MSQVEDITGIVRLEQELAALRDRVTLLELAIGDDALRERLNARAALIEANNQAKVHAPGERRFVAVPFSEIPREKS